MLELVAQAVAQRGAFVWPSGTVIHDLLAITHSPIFTICPDVIGSGEARTGAHDLLSEFQLQPFYNLSMKSVDRNYISISTKEVPTGLPGDTSLFA